MKPSEMRRPVHAWCSAPTLIACATRDDDYLLLRRTGPAAAGEPTRLTAGAAERRRGVLPAPPARERLRRRADADIRDDEALRRPDFAAIATRETTIALGRPDAGHRSTAIAPRRVQIGWWRRQLDGDAPIIWIDDSPGRGARSSMADLVSGFGGAIVDVIAPETGTPDARVAALRDGYVAFLQVVGVGVAAATAPPTIATSCAGSASSRTCGPTTRSGRPRGRANG